MILYKHTISRQEQINEFKKKNLKRERLTKAEKLKNQVSSPEIFTNNKSSKNFWYGHQGLGIAFWGYFQ